MSLPTERQIRDLFTTLRAFATPTGKPPASRLDNLEHRLVTALTRDRTGTTNIDGYPTSTISSGRGSSSTPVDPNNPFAGSVTLTSVENAAGRDPAIDKIHDHTINAISFLFEAAGNLNALEHRLDLIDKLSEPTPRAETAGTGYCQACGDYCPGSGDHRLRAAYCPPCYKAWTRAGRPDRPTFERTRRVPTQTSRS